MKYQEALALESDRPIEIELLIELGNLLQQQGIEVYCFDIDSSCFEKCQELLVEKGRETHSFDKKTSRGDSAEG